MRSHCNVEVNEANEEFKRKVVDYSYLGIIVNVNIFQFLFDAWFGIRTVGWRFRTANKYFNKKLGKLISTTYKNNILNPVADPELHLWGGGLEIPTFSKDSKY